MDLPTTLSKFQIQENEESFFFLYSDDIRVISRLIVFFQDLRVFNYEIIHNTIIINKRIYNQLINKCYGK